MSDMYVSLDHANIYHGKKDTYLFKSKTRKHGSPQARRRECEWLVSRCLIRHRTFSSAEHVSLLDSSLIEVGKDQKRKEKRKRKERRDLVDPHNFQVRAEFTYH